MTRTQPTRQSRNGATDRRPPSSSQPFDQLTADGHTWWTRSRHSTSDGILRYQRCSCGRWRVLLGVDAILEL